MKESQLGEILTNWLIDEGWNVYPEVQIKSRGPRADLMAIKDNILWVIEIKKTMSLQLLQQAVNWLQRGAINISVAIPYIPRRRAGSSCWHSRIVDDILRYYGIGLIFIREEQVLQPIKPKLFRFNYAKSRLLIKNLDSRMKQYVAGNTTTDGYSTPKSRVIEDCIRYIAKHPNCSLQQLSRAIKTPHYRVPKIKKYILSALETIPGILISQTRLEFYFILRS